MTMKKRGFAQTSNRRSQKGLAAKPGGASPYRYGMKEPSWRSAWVDPDDAPEWTPEQLESADIYRGNKLVRRGRPPSDNAKLALKLRIDPDVVEHFRATGPGWQTRINDTLRRAVKLPARR